MPSKVKSKVSDRQVKEGVNRWHIQRGANKILYTDFGDLLTIIQNKWSDFEVFGVQFFTS